MKILHTADWHIGKKIYNQSLSEDFDLFVDFLTQLIIDKEIDVLLISGDIFDQANPSAEARSQYYQSLLKLHQTNCKIIITGGNHDSAQMLNAPQELVKALDIHVFGGLTDDLSSFCIPLYNKENILELVVLAIPFLRDTDFRRANKGYSYENRLENIQKGIEHTYQQIYEIAKKEFGDVPLLAMGHLFTTGAITSESERDIQIGNQAAFDANRLGNMFEYVALGHIHKPQKVGSSTPIYYSGSPLPLSFSERKDDKRILLIDTEIGYNPISITLPKFRKLIRIQGDFNHIKQKLQQLECETPLTSFVEILLKEEKYDAQKIVDIEQVIDSFSSDNVEIIHKKIHFSRNLIGTGAYSEENNQTLSEIKPQEVFQRLLTQQDFNEETSKELYELFLEILEEEYKE